MPKPATMTSKGQITVPNEVRRDLGTRAGDKFLFKKVGKIYHFLPVKKISPFEKYRGIGNPGIPSGRKGMLRYIREMRGR
jgi:AbrB family looped-hinge helix DNA binding protein